MPNRTSPTGSGVHGFSGWFKDQLNNVLEIYKDSTILARLSTTTFNFLGSNGFGFPTGESLGGSVTQITNRSTGVTLNTISGAITTDATSLAAGAEATFTVTNNKVVATDVILLSARSGQTADTSVPIVTAVAAGSFNITLTNLHASTADTGAMVINFVVIKAADN